MSEEPLRDILQNIMKFIYLIYLSVCLSVCLSIRAFPIPILVSEIPPIPQILASVLASTWTHEPIQYHFLKQDL